MVLFQTPGTFMKIASVLSSLVLSLSMALSVNCFADDRLIFALDLIRHGDRTSIDSIPNASYTWPEGQGQLTALGMQQEYQLGLKLNHRYRIDNQLLATNYQADAVYIRSTDYDRTLMSAQSVLMALYPLGTGPNLADASPALPSNFQPIPIHTVSKAQDAAFLIRFSSPELAELLKNYVYTRADWQKKSTELAQHYGRWSQLTGLSINDMFDVVSLGDTLHTYMAHDIPLPSGLTTTEAKQIVDAGDWIYACIFKPHQIGDAAGKAGLETIVSYIRQAAEHKTKTKFLLVSAHDLTILGVMSALHAPLDTPPPYASDLNFSLYESDLGDYYVRVTYNDKPVSIPGCNGNKCSLDQLIKNNR
jgi:acid phosphatase